jgi:hypothetical protein
MILMNLDLDNVILALSKNSLNIFKSNTNKFNSKSRESKVTVSEELAKTDLRSIDSSESLILSKMKTTMLRKNKSE